MHICGRLDSSRTAAQPRGMSRWGPRSVGGFLRANLLCAYSLCHSFSLITFFYFTGWSKETVDCKFLLTDPKFSKSVITQWFLESLYREVLVFWCFKSVRCVEFCLLMYFQCRAFVAPDKAWALQNTLTHIQTPKTYIHFTLMFTITSSRHQQQLIDTNRHQQTVPGNPKGCSRMRGASCWHQMAFAGVPWGLMVPDGVC